MAAIVAGKVWIADKLLIIPLSLSLDDAKAPSETIPVVTEKIIATKKRSLSLIYPY
jgi:hypothetical protein